MYVRVADGMRSGRASSERNRARMDEERGRLGGGKEEKRGRERQSTERTASILTQAGSYRAAQTNKLGLYLELEGANAEDDEARGIGAARRTAWRPARAGAASRRTRETENSGQSFVIAK